MKDECFKKRSFFVFAGLIPRESLECARDAAIKEIELRLRYLSNFSARLPRGYKGCDQRIDKDLKVAFDSGASDSRFPGDVAQREELTIENRRDPQKAGEGGDVLYERLLSVFVQIPTWYSPTGLDLYWV